MKLYLAHVGFYDEAIGMYELHSNLFVVAEDVATAKQKIKNKNIFTEKKMHIDGIQEISNVDDYEICLIKQLNSNDNKVYGYDDVKKLA